MSNKEFKLSDLTTLGIGGSAIKFYEFDSKKTLLKLMMSLDGVSDDIFILGEGSNVAFSSSNYSAVVIKPANKGIKVIERTENFTYVEVQAAENWDEFVKYTVKRGLWGIENMSLIPGSVGACPVQNVGAYGQDCSAVIEYVNAYHIASSKFVNLSNEECRFGFRSSIFNKTRKNEFIITSVVFKLANHKKPCLTRASVKRNVCESSESLQEDIRKVIIEERTNGLNLPNKAHIGSAGTFFKTAIVKKSEVFPIILKTLFKLGPKITVLLLGFIWKYRSKEGCKLPSKLLINACRLQNEKFGSFSLLPTNPACVISDLNVGPNSDDLLLLIKEIRKEVFFKTGVKLPIEPTLIGFSESELQEVFSLT